MRDDSQERTEQATPKKQKESRERGLVARSKDFNSLIVLLFGCFAVLIFGSYIYSKAIKIFEFFFTFDSRILHQGNALMVALNHGMKDGFFIVLPIMGLIFCASIVGVLLMGGWTFTLSNAAFKFERLDPIKGLAKIFSSQGLMELLKSFIKVVLVLAAGILIFFLYFKKMIALNTYDLKIGMGYSAEILIYSFFILSASLIVVELMDVPYQMWNYRQQLMMTKQELKEEYKETEGKPEVKSKIHKMRRELSRRRMMSAVPTADVIITNPTHFAVALKYAEGKMKAPIVVAKGADLVAQRIIEIGKEHAVPLISMPPLARSIFFHTEIGDEIPQKLYMAVAQVLAYVHQLKLYRRGKLKKPKLPEKINIPEDMLK